MKTAKSRNEAIYMEKKDLTIAQQQFIDFANGALCASDKRVDINTANGKYSATCKFDYKLQIMKIQTYFDDELIYTYIYDNEQNKVISEYVGEI